MTWPRWRGPLIMVLILLVASIGLAAIQSGSRRGYLDPQGVDQSGSRAVANLLADQGVDVRAASTLDAAARSAGPGSTILVTVPDLLQPAQVERLFDTGADLVLVAPRNPAILADRLDATGMADVKPREPRCADPVAERAGPARTGGLQYSTDDPAAISCYPAGPGASLVAIRSGGRTLTVLGSPDILTNRYVDEDGNAALALGVLGRQKVLVWYRTTLEAAPAGGDAALWDLLPHWVAPVVGQLLVAAVVTALWRARRLGPLVSEPLPVVVRAAEVVEGRARLYRRAGARDLAAAALRRASGARLARLLGLPQRAQLPDVASAVAARIKHPEGEILSILAGPAPEDDATLVRLADSLDILEQEVRQT